MIIREKNAFGFSGIAGIDKSVPSNLMKKIVGISAISFQIQSIAASWGGNVANSYDMVCRFFYAFSAMGFKLLRSRRYFPASDESAPVIPPARPPANTASNP